VKCGRQGGGRHRLCTRDRRRRTTARSVSDTGPVARARSSARKGVGHLAGRGCGSWHRGGVWHRPVARARCL